MSRVWLITEYADSVGTALPDSDGQQPGDPARAAAAILSALDSAEPPLHLLLGNDSADAVSNQLDRGRTEFAAWEAVTRGTDIAS